MKFTLRAWNKNDVESLIKYANNLEISKYLTNKFPYPYTREAAENFIAFATSTDSSHIFAIAIQGEACGAIGIHPQEDIFIKNAELGYWLAQPYWGKSIMTQAVKETVPFGFANFDITRIFARPFGTNIGSQKVLEKAGFKLEARYEKTIWKNEAFEDELVYAVRRDEYNII